MYLLLATDPLQMEHNPVPSSCVMSAGNGAQPCDHAIHAHPWRVVEICRRGKVTVPAEEA